MAKEIDLTGIDNVNEYYTNHYLNTIFAENIDTQIKIYKERATEEEERTPWSKLKAMARHYYAAHEHSSRERFSEETLEHIERLAQYYLEALGYPALQPETITLDGEILVPVALEIKKSSGAPLLWVLLSASHDLSASVMAGHFFAASLGEISFTEQANEELVGKILFDQQEPPRWLLPGETYRKTYTDDTQPGGPVERNIEYVAPFDRCDREEDYETAWKFFSEKYGERR